MAEDAPIFPGHEISSKGTDKQLLLKFQVQLADGNQAALVDAHSASGWDEDELSDDEESRKAYFELLDKLEEKKKAEEDAQDANNSPPSKPQ